MKLAEALLLRRDLESKLTLLREEIASSAVIQEGDTLTAASTTYCWIMKQQTKNLPSWSLQSISEMRSPKSVNKKRLLLH